MNFSFGNTAGTSQSTAKPKLPGNAIHSVIFEGCEPQDIQGVKDPSIIYKVLKLRFVNDDGVYEHTIFEPKDDDHQRRESEFKNKNGNIEKIPQPSNVESMMLFFKHAIDTINPAVALKIDNKEANLGAKNWDDLRTLVCKILNVGKGTSFNIKLLKNKNGEAIFPGFFAGLTKDGVAYVKNNFIGNKISFSSYEADRIKNERMAKPQQIDAFGNTGSTPINLAPIPPDTSDLDMNFEL